MAPHAIRWAVAPTEDRDGCLDEGEAPSRPLRATRLIAGNLDSIVARLEPLARQMDAVLDTSRALADLYAQRRRKELKIRQFEEHASRQEAECARLESLRGVRGPDAPDVDSEIARVDSLLVAGRAKLAQKRATLGAVDASIRSTLRASLAGDDAPSPADPPAETPAMDAVVAFRELFAVERRAPSPVESLRPVELGPEPPPARTPPTRWPRVGVAAALAALAAGVALGVRAFADAPPAPRHADVAPAVIPRPRAVPTDEVALSAYRWAVLRHPLVARKLPRGAREPIERARTIDEVRHLYSEGMRDVLGFGEAQGGRGTSLSLELASILAPHDQVATFAAIGRDVIEVRAREDAVAAIRRAFGSDIVPSFALMGRDGASVSGGDTPSRFSRERICRGDLNLMVSVPVTFPPGLEAPLAGVTLSVTLFARRHMPLTPPDELCFGRWDAP